MQQGVSARRKLWIATASAVAILVAAGVVATVVLGRGADRSGGGDSTGATPFGREPAAQRPLVIAHRGASAYAPHDTVAAAQEAVRRGADAVEVDVRQTRDGRLVALFHGTLAPTTNVEQVYPRRSPWRVEAFSLREIRRLDAGSWFSAEFSGERVPTLTELTDSISGSDLRVIVEVKKPRRYPGVADRLLRELQSRPHRYAEVESFSVPFLRSFARRTPPVRLGYSGTFPAARLDELATFADAVNAHKTIDRSYVELAHRHGLQVKVWSVNSEAGMQRALRLGVDGIYTHRPDVLRRLVGMRQPRE